MADIDWAKEYSWLKAGNAAAVFAAVTGSGRLWQYEELAAAAGLSVSMAHSAVSTLAGKGLLERERSSRGSSTIWLPSSPAFRTALEKEPVFQLVQLATFLSIHAQTSPTRGIINVLSAMHGTRLQGNITGYPDSEPWLVDSAALLIACVLRSGEAGITSDKAADLVGLNRINAQGMLGAAASRGGLIRAEQRYRQEALLLPGEGWVAALARMPVRRLALLALAASQDRALPPLQAVVASLGEAWREVTQQ